MTKRYSLRINAKDKGVKIFDNVDDDNWRVLNLHFNNYEDTQFVKSKLIPVVALLNDFAEENEQLKETIKEVTELLEEEVDLFSDKATKHDINAYVELRELDNKDAFYMATATKKAINMLKELI